MQWQDGRSAKELAKAWFPEHAISTPQEISALLESSDALGKGVRLCEGEPEAVVRIDSLRGESPNCDLLIQGTCQRGKMAIYVEAKTDEPFGETVGRKLAKGKRINKKIDKSKQSRESDLPERIRNLAHAVLGRSDEDCLGLRYQLVYGTAAALCAARMRDASAAIFVVHEFVTKLTTGTKLKKNAEDLNNFVRALSGNQAQSITPGRLLGPFRVPGNEHIPANLDLFVGKAIRTEPIDGA